MPGVTIRRSGPRRRAPAAASGRGADDAVDADVARLRGAAGDEVRRRRRRIARLGEVLVVVGGQHGDGEDLQGRARLPGHRRAHGLRIGVDGQEGGAEPGDRAHALLDRVADVVELEVEEDLLALADQFAGEAKPPA